MLKNVTFSSEEVVLERARERARRKNTSLNAEFRRWLSRYAEEPRAGEIYDDLMSRLDYAKLPRKLTRDEMNER